MKMILWALILSPFVLAGCASGGGGFGGGGMYQQQSAGGMMQQRASASGVQGTITCPEGTMPMNGQCVGNAPRGK
jgi:hypothetical protein